MKQKIATRCSCCGVHLDRRSRSDSALDHNTEESNKKTTHMLPSVVEDDQSKEMPPQHLEFFVYGDNCCLIPVEFTNSSAAAAAGTENRNRYKVEEDEDVTLDFDMLGGDGEEAEHTLENWHVSGDTGTILLQDEDDLKQSHQDLNIGPTFEHPHRNHNVEGGICRGVCPALEEDDEFEAQVSIGTEILDEEVVNEYQIQDILLEDSNQQIQEDPSSGSVGFHALNESGGDKDEEEFVEFKTMSIETSIPKVENDQLESCLELNDEIKEEKIPDTPTSINSLHHLHKKLLFLERKEDSATEESLDGSVISRPVRGSDQAKLGPKPIGFVYMDLGLDLNPHNLLPIRMG